MQFSIEEFDWNALLQIHHSVTIISSKPCRFFVSLNLLEVIPYQVRDLTSDAKGTLVTVYNQYRSFDST